MFNDHLYLIKPQSFKVTAMLRYILHISWRPRSFQILGLKIRHSSIDSSFKDAFKYQKL